MNSKIIALLVVVSIISSSQAGWGGWKKALHVASGAARLWAIRHGDQHDQELYNAVMDELVTDLSDEVGEEKAYKLIKDMAKKIEVEEHDIALAGAYELDNSNQAEKKDPELDEENSNQVEKKELAVLIQSLLKSF